jgi:hypothetical protein
MTIEDTATVKGGIGLFTSGTLNAHFTDVIVDDFLSSAPVVYRFSFLTSRFKNFVDHLASYDNKTSLTIRPRIAAATN